MGWLEGGQGSTGHAVSCKDNRDNRDNQDNQDNHHHRMSQGMERGRCWVSTLRYLEAAKSHDKAKEDGFQDLPEV